MEQIVGIAYSGEAGHDAGKIDHGVLEALMFGKSAAHPPEDLPAALDGAGPLDARDRLPAVSTR